MTSFCANDELELLCSKDIAIAPIIGFPVTRWNTISTWEQKSVSRSGKGGSTKFDEFSEGGRGHFQSKNICCRFWNFKQGFLSMKFEKNAIWFSKNELGRGGQRPFGKFTRFGGVTRPSPTTYYLKWLLLVLTSTCPLWSECQRRNGAACVSVLGCTSNTQVYLCWPAQPLVYKTCTFAIWNRHRVNVPSQEGLSHLEGYKMTKQFSGSFDLN